LNRSSRYLNQPPQAFPVTEHSARNIQASRRFLSL